MSADPLDLGIVDDDPAMAEHAGLHGRHAGHGARQGVRMTHQAADLLVACMHAVTEGDGLLGPRFAGVVHSAEHRQCRDDHDADGQDPTAFGLYRPVVTISCFRSFGLARTRSAPTPCDRTRRRTHTNSDGPPGAAPRPAISDSPNPSGLPRLGITSHHRSSHMAASTNNATTAA